MSRLSCDVCGTPNARPLSAEELASWWWLARWIRCVCRGCHARFQRSAERHGGKAAA